MVAVTAMQWAPTFAAGNFATTVSAACWHGVDRPCPGDSQASTLKRHPPS